MSRCSFSVSVRTDLPKSSKYRFEDQRARSLTASCAAATQIYLLSYESRVEGPEFAEQQDRVVPFLWGGEKGWGLG